MNINRTMVKMIPKTLKGRNRIREAKISVWTMFLPVGSFQGKPAFLVEAPDTPNTLRWVLERDDPDFDYIALEDWNEDK